MIQRNALEYMRQWRRSTMRKPLILRGARQVGKTTLVRMFAQEFDCFLPLNLDEQSDRSLFQRYNNTDQLLEAIYLHLRQKKGSGDTLLFIDEIQNSPEAVAMLRYFYERHPELHVVAAGSLLENVIDRKISFPVGRVEYLALHPCSFSEYLEGIGEQSDREALLSMQGHYIHERLMTHFRNYCIVGGMPEAVVSYSNTRDLLAQDRIYDALIASYSDDVEKYSSGDSQTKVMRHILGSGWQHGGEIISFERFGGSNYRSREVGEAFRTLQKAMLLELAYPTVNTSLPLEAQMARHPKLIWIDTGLMNFVSGVREEVFSIADISDAYRGRVAEQVVAQEMLTQTMRVTDRRYYWVGGKRNSQAEIDFVWRHQARVVPVEVKSGTNAHLRSLHSFMAEAPHDVAVRIWSKPLSIDEVREPTTGRMFRLLNVPFYYVGQMERLLQEKA